jgi:hypothetical protein
MNTWIKVDTQLPHTDEDVLVTDGFYTTVAFNDVDGKWIPSNVEPTYDMSSVYVDFDIKFWTHLPHLPVILEDENE